MPRMTAEYGYFIADRPIEFVTCRVQSVGEVPKPPVIMYRGRPFDRGRAHRQQARLHRYASWLAGLRPSTSARALPVSRDGPRPVHRQRDERDDDRPARPERHCRSPRQHHPAGGRMSTPVSTPIARPLHRRPALRRDPDGGVQQPPARHRRGHGLDPDPLVVLHQHQGAARLLDRAVRCAPAGSSPRPTTSRSISAR